MFKIMPTLLFSLSIQANPTAGIAPTFIGSPTSGANGSVTTVVLPGALRASFPGDSIRHADGRQLQGVGLQLQILVRPTIQGLAEGRGEVPEETITFLQNR
jgi:hypothetical protein